jgi:hypothetical protein
MFKARSDVIAQWGPGLAQEKSQRLPLAEHIAGGLAQAGVGFDQLVGALPYLHYLRHGEWRDRHRLLSIEGRCRRSIYHDGLDMISG